MSRSLLRRGVLLIPLVIAAKRKVEHDHLVWVVRVETDNQPKKEPTDMKRQPPKSLLSMRARSKFRLSALVPILLAVLALCLPFRVLLAAEPLSKSASLQIQAVEDEKARRTPAQNKMDSQFVYALKKKAVGVATRAAPQLQPNVEILADGRVLVDITATVSDELLAQIKKLGGEVISSFAQYNAIRALVPLTSLEHLAERRDVRFIERAAMGTTNTGSVDGEGDTTHRAIGARAVFGVTGAGVNVGVLSDSVDFLLASQTLVDLGAVTILPGQSGVPATGEGTAMLEIVHDLAPGSPLFFATANGAPAAMATNITNLGAAGCNIIVDDVTYFNESPFQDGPISVAVNAFSAAGGLYFSSARNSGNLKDGTSSTWEGDFADGGAAGPPVTGAGRLHNFGGGATFNTLNTVPIRPNNRRADLFWADPLGGSANDYDLFVLDATGTTLVQASTTAQTGTQDPYEFVGGNVAPLVAGQRLVIVQRTGAAGRFLHLDAGRCTLAIATAGCVRGHNASGAANAFSVAATSALNSFPNAFSGGALNPVETFSSDGPRRIFFDAAGNPITPGNFSSTGGLVLQKPEITAADQVTSSAAVSTGCSFSPPITPCFTPFGGTSAAAPHAAAIAALLLSYAPGLTPAQVRTALMSTALDIEAPGFDINSGAGIVMAFQALNSVNPCTLTCPADITQGNDPGQCGAVVTYSPPSTSGFCGTVTCTPGSGSFFPVGTSSVSCTSTTGASCSFNVTVNDTEPPKITGASVDQPVLWPPNHKLVNVSVNYEVTDNCPLPPNSCTLSVTSNEPLNGTGDGNTSPDWIILDAHHVQLRAERAGNGNGRIYTITITCIDSSGNSSSQSVEVNVPHDQGRR
jgi:Subtilase family/HYR domain